MTLLCCTFGKYLSTQKHDDGQARQQEQSFENYICLNLKFSEVPDNSQRHFCTSQMDI